MQPKATVIRFHGIKLKEIKRKNKYELQESVNSKPENFDAW